MANTNQMMDGGGHSVRIPSIAPNLEGGSAFGEELGNSPPAIRGLGRETDHDCREDQLGGGGGKKIFFFFFFGSGHMPRRLCDLEGVSENSGYTNHDGPPARTEKAEFTPFSDINVPWPSKLEETRLRRSKEPQGKLPARSRPTGTLRSSSWPGQKGRHWQRSSGAGGGVARDFPGSRKAGLNGFEKSRWGPFALTKKALCSTPL